VPDHFQEGTLGPLTGWGWQAAFAPNRPATGRLSRSGCPRLHRLHSSATTIHTFVILALPDAFLQFPNPSTWHPYRLVFISSRYSSPLALSGRSSRLTCAPLPNHFTASVSPVCSAFPGVRRLAYTRVICRSLDLVDHWRYAGTSARHGRMPFLSSSAKFFHFHDFRSAVLRS